MKKRGSIICLAIVALLVIILGSCSQPEPKKAPCRLSCPKVPVIAPAADQAEELFVEIPGFLEKYDYDPDMDDPWTFFPEKFLAIEVEKGDIELVYDGKPLWGITLEESRDDDFLSGGRPVPVISRGQDGLGNFYVFIHKDGRPAVNHLFINGRKMNMLSFGPEAHQYDFRWFGGSIILVKGMKKNGTAEFYSVYDLCH